MAKIRDTLNSLSLVGILIILLLCYRRISVIEDISKLRYKAQLAEDRGRAETAKGERIQFEAMAQEIKSLSDRADFQSQELKLLGERSESVKIRRLAQRWLDAHPSPWSKK